MTRPLAITIVVLLIAIALLLTVILYQLSWQRPVQPMWDNFDHQRMMRIMMRDYSKPSYRSLGERIYLTGRDATGRPIPNSMMGRGMMNMMTMGCANCHKANAQGGVLFPDGRTRTKDIRWQHLRKEYNEPTLRRAITEGIDHDGKPMSQFMPRWRLTGKQTRSLIDYLKTK